MKRNISDLFKLFILTNLLILALLSMPEQSATSEFLTSNKHQAKGDIAMIAVHTKSDLKGGE